MISAIESARLRLIPLDLYQLELLVQDRESLERSLHLQYAPMELSYPGFLEELDMALDEFIIPHVKTHRENYDWYTHWLIVEKSSNTCIGGIGSNGLPDAYGQVMVGYYISEDSEGFGFATEALGSFINWMRQEPSLKLVVADTPKEHVASQKVLGNNGFNLQGEVEDGFRWQLHVAANSTA